jgi:hypothetical protein
MLLRIWRWVYPALIIGAVMIAAITLGQKASDNAQQIAAAQSENHSQDKQITSLSESLATANAKLQNAGLPTVPVVVQPSNGTNGRDGQDGRSVLATTCDPSGLWVVTYSDGVTSPAGQGCVGVPGVAGAVGAAGQPGTNGVDGQPGQPGADGAVGATGPAGTPGSPPLSWTYSDQNGRDYTCTRTDPFDASAPTYQCGITPPTEGEKQ